MADQPVVIQKISWSELCPWTIIFRTLPVATSFTVLALALLAIVVTPMGWRIGEAFLPTDIREAKMEEVSNNHSPYRGVFSETPDGLRPLSMLGVRITGPREVFRQLVNRIPSVKQDTFLTVNEGDCAIAACRGGESGIIGEHACLCIKLADVDDVRAGGWRMDRQFV